MDDKHLSAPRTVADYYKLFSQACIESIYNYYGCYGLSEIDLGDDGNIHISHYGITLEVSYGKISYMLWNNRHYKYENDE